MIALTVGMTAENTDKSSDRHPDPKLESEQLQSASRGLVVATSTIVGSVLTGLGIGYLIDRAAGTSPRWTVAMLVLFVAGGLYAMIRGSIK
ncbi:MAG: AtpZ/AtpI family protein [Planctomycetes bacterium]|nr:AtpZ/AtpI family protein [Planctomycetota bacterium]